MRKMRWKKIRRKGERVQRQRNDREQGAKRRGKESWYNGSKKLNELEVHDGAERI